MDNEENLADKIRQALANVQGVEEKEMFGRTAFMINKKLCLTAGEGRMMCRIDPEIHEEALKREGCSTMIMKGKELKGYVNINEHNLQSNDHLNYWVELALEFNKKAKASRKR